MKIFKKLTLGKALLFALTLFLFAACEEEKWNTSSGPQNAEMTISQDKTIANARFGGGVCFPIIDPKRFVITPFGTIDCEEGWGLCSNYYYECLPWINPCAIIPCGIDWIDPWVIYPELDPGVFESFRDIGQIKINPHEQIAYFPVNESILGMQFYEEWPGTLTKDRLHLRTSWVINEEDAAQFGLKGGVVPAGVYPVIYNEKNGTFNALTSLSDYPIKYDRLIVKLIPQNFKGSLNDLMKSFGAEKQYGSQLVETGAEMFNIEPNFEKGIEGIYAFSAGQFDLNLVFYGDPEPQPNKFDPTPTPMKGDPNPQPSKVWLDNDIMLPDYLAELINVKPFLLTPENVFQQYDEKAGVLRVTILNR